MRIDKPDPSALSPEQKQALDRLHQAATQMESVFVDMLFKEMRKSAPPVNWTGGKPSSAETTFTEMLDQKRADAMASTGQLGIARVIEDQLRDQVLANPSAAARTKVPGQNEL